MRRMIECAAMLALVAMPAVTTAAQPLQFKATLKTKNGTDNTTSNGTIYFGGAKIRTELTTDGQNTITLVDPAAKTQYILIPDEKTYMQMALGGGKTGASTNLSDPANPCASGSGNTDCVQGGRETVNGYETTRWDYTSADGVRTRSWISPRLHYAVKTQDDNGSSTEITNVIEGPQPASLFGIPAGYKKMDMGMMGGAGGGRGRGRANANDPIATAMANMPADLQAQMAAAMRGDGPKSPTGTAGSGWEKTKGWVINVTVNGTSSSGTDKANFGAVGGQVKRRETYTLKIVGAIPLNVLGGASGMPGAPGPSWQLMYTDVIGSPEVLATPATFNVEVRGRIDETPGTVASYCKEAAAALASGLGIGNPSTSVGIVKGDADMRVPITKRTYGANAEGNIRIAADLKTYDLSIGFGTKGKEVTDTNTETTSCKDGKVTTKNDTRTAEPDYTVQFDLNGLPMPSAVGPISGSKKMPVKFANEQYDATVSWTIAPIR